ncbi:MAG TPA: hypothetical protein VGJ84_16355 [Polyangiaceae bacterium]
MPASVRHATLVVIEFGGAWPRWLENSPSGDVAVVAQHYAGDPGSLIAQVASRITRLELVGWQVSSIVLVANDRSDREASSVRAVLGRCLLAGLKAQGRGTLTLTSGHATSSRQSGKLVHMARALDLDLAGSAVLVAVRGHDGSALYERASGFGELAHAS